MKKHELINEKYESYTEFLQQQELERAELNTKKANTNRNIAAILENIKEEIDNVLKEI